MLSDKLTFCSRCVMDGSAQEIVLDKNGVCNFCHQAQKTLKEIELEKPNLDKWIKKIKDDGRKYDCIIGLSGGVDSATLLVKAIELGLRPMCFSMDNGYNDPKADENVVRLVEALKVPFYRYILDLEKFRELQSAYLRAGVINVEAIYDNLLAGASYEMAERYGVKWILSGGNVVSESIMPSSWSYRSGDLINIKDICKKIAGKNIKAKKGSFPLFGISKFNYYKWIKGIKIFYLLDYLDYNRKQSEQMLIEKYGFQSTGEKHEENVFTRWYQSFYLYQKFGIDKRKAHFSSLINAGQMTRSEAMFLLTANPVYPQIGIEKRVMSYQKRSHYDFKTDEWLWNFLANTIRVLRGLLRK